MSDQNDESQNYALMVIAGVVGLVVAGVLTLAAWGALRGHDKPAAAAAAAPVVAAVAAGDSASAAVAAGSDAASGAAAGAASAPAGEPEGRIYFDLASDALPADAAAVIARVTEAARAHASSIVHISGFHDASGDAAKNAELAKKRAFAVRDALVAAGLPAERIALEKPVVATGGGDAREARRVELRVR